VTHLSSLVKLDDFQEPLGFVDKVDSLNVGFDRLFNLLVRLGWDACLTREDILNEGCKERLILGYELGKVHITEGTSHNHLFVGASGFSSLGVTSGTEHRQNVSKTEVIVALFGQLLLAQLVEDVELLGKCGIGAVADRGELDHHNDVSAGHHHSDTAEKDLQVLGKLLTTSVTGVHGNEVSTSHDKFDWLFFVGEHEHL
jgi:hypothetical protein